MKSTQLTDELRKIINKKVQDMGAADILRSCTRMSTYSHYVVVPVSPLRISLYERLDQTTCTDSKAV